MRPDAHPVLTVVGVNDAQLYAGPDEEILQNLVEDLRREGGEQRCGGGGGRHGRRRGRGGGGGEKKNFFCEVVRRREGSRTEAGIKSPGGEKALKRASSHMEGARAWRLDR